MVCRHHRPLHLLPHQNLRHLHRPLLVHALLMSLIAGTADSMGSMKLGVSTKVAAGSPRVCRVCLGVFTLMAMRNRPLNLLPHRHQRHLHRPLLHRPLLHRPLLLHAALKTRAAKNVDTAGSMKLGAASEIAAGSHRVLLVCLGAFSKLMAAQRWRHLLL